MGTGATAAAIAAARRREEEEMTSYTESDLAGGWEFKMLRSATAAFRKPEVLRTVIREEAQAGWMLVEKFDDGRLRFKRPVAAREGDGRLPAGVDPYRTRYGMGESKLALLIIAMVLGSIGMLITLLTALRS